MAPMGVDWGIQEFFKYESNNLRRLFTGLFGGYGVGMIYVLIALSIYQIAVNLFINTSFDNI